MPFMRTVGKLKKEQKAGSEGKGRQHNSAAEQAAVSKEGGNAAPRLRSLQTLAIQVS